jgi:copper chaperone CopZ
MTIDELHSLILEDGVALSAVVRPVDPGIPWEVVVEVHYPHSADSVAHWERITRDYTERGAMMFALKIINVTCLSCADRLTELEPKLWGCEGCGGMFDEDQALQPMSHLTDPEKIDAAAVLARGSAGDGD